MLSLTSAILYQHLPSISFPSCHVCTIVYLVAFLFPRFHICTKTHFHNTDPTHLHRLLPSQPSKLCQPHPRQYSHERDQTSHKHRPQTDPQDINIIIRLRGRGRRGQQHQEDKVPSHTVVLVQLLCIFLTTVQPRDKVLREADHDLAEDQNVGDEAEDGVRRLEMCALVRKLVVLDDDEAGEGGQKREVVDGGVGPRAGAFLLCREGEVRVSTVHVARQEWVEGGWYRYPLYAWAARSARLE